MSQEAANHIEYPISDLRSVAYTATPTSRLLFEARFGMRRAGYAYTPTSDIDPQRLLDPGDRAGRADSRPAVSWRRDFHARRSRINAR